MSAGEPEPPVAGAAGSPIDFLERLLLAGVGVVVLTAERIDELARDLAGHGELRRDEARETIEEAVVRWRGEATRLTERTGQNLQSFFDQLGLVPREAHDELELRVAQLEHRLRLAESHIEGTPPPARVPPRPEVAPPAGAVEPQPDEAESSQPHLAPVQE
jgi:polyhydroxyalkanoate synthesis regulator phasin